MLGREIGEVQQDLKRFARPRLFQPAYPAIFRSLLKHVALGEWESAEAIWSRDPVLLRTPGTVNHPNHSYTLGQVPIDFPEDKSLGRYKYVNCTVWQIALMNEEYEEAARMGQRMTNEEKQNQFLEIFPEGRVEYSQDFAKAEVLLQRLISAVIEDRSIKKYEMGRMNKATQKALNTLRDFIKPEPEHTKGLVFDPNIYVAALKLYDSNKSLFKNWGQRIFWIVQVEEMIASVMGTGYLRPHAQGVRLSPYHRKGCLLRNGSSYFALQLPPLLSDSFVGAYGETDIARGARELAEDYSKIISRKNERKEELVRECLPICQHGISK